VSPDRSRQPIARQTARQIARHIARHIARGPSRHPGRAALGLLLLGLAASACAVNPTPQPTAQAIESYRVGPPDQLFISILPEPVIERTTVIRPDGFISIDLIGDVRATGRTVEEISADIQDKISRFKRDAAVTVSVVSAQSNSITIFGQVNAPGTFTLQRDTRVSEALGMAGGSTIFASKGRIRVIRSLGPRTDVLMVSLTEIERGDLGSNIELAGGDIIIVPPNALARFGFALQTLLFPLQPALSFGASALGAVSRGL